MTDNPWNPPFQPGSLRQLMRQATERGRASGALLPIPTTFEFVEDHGIPFVIRVVDNLRRKDEARRRQSSDAARGAPANPFLPCDPDLHVADVSDDHVAVLNKFNVLDDHLLIVTRAFEHQETVLTAADFHALWRCMREIDGLGFYNGGVVAGASQEHKHLQLAPYPIIEGQDGLPVDTAIRTANRPGIFNVEAFPFLHTATSCPAAWRDEPHRAACECHARYVALMAAAGLWLKPGETQQPAPYNLLVTRDWMMVIPRAEELFEGVSINAIGYAGGLLVQNEKQLERVRKVGPMHIVTAGAFPSPTAPADTRPAT